MDPILQEYGLLGIALYLLVKDILPMAINAFSKLGEMVLPARAKQQEMKLKAEAEQEARLIDIQEREAVALEQIGKTLVAIDTRLQHQDDKIDLMSAGLVTANQALAIILDRMN